jgi:hypothetical protein
LRSVNGSSVGLLTPGASFSTRVFEAVGYVDVSYAVDRHIKGLADVFERQRGWATRSRRLLPHLAVVVVEDVDVVSGVHRHAREVVDVVTEWQYDLR